MLQNRKYSNVGCIHLLGKLTLRIDLWIDGQTKEYGLNYNVTHKRESCFFCSLMTAWTCFSEAEIEICYGESR